MNTYKLVYLTQLRQDITEIQGDSFDLVSYNTARFYRHSYEKRETGFLFKTQRTILIKELIAEAHCVLTVVMTKPSDPGDGAVTPKNESERCAAGAHTHAEGQRP